MILVQRCSWKLGQKIKDQMTIGIRSESAVSNRFNWFPSYRTIWKDAGICEYHFGTMRYHFERFSRITPNLSHVTLNNEVNALRGWKGLPTLTWYYQVVSGIQYPAVAGIRYYSCIRSHLISGNIRSSALEIPRSNGHRLFELQFQTTGFPPRRVKAPDSKFGMQPNLSRGFGWKEFPPMHLWLQWLSSWSVGGPPP